LGLDYALPSLIFLTTILGAVIYLTLSRTDVIEKASESVDSAPAQPARERVMLGYYAVVAGAAAALLVWAAAQPHSAPASASVEDGGSSASAETLAPGQVSAAFPAADVMKYRTITQETLDKVKGGDQTSAAARIKDLETGWDNDQSTLQPMAPATWAVLDAHIDQVLKALRATAPDVATETQALSTLLTDLR
jgi:hypothetical protein